jgi:hypothetical protein
VVGWVNALTVVEFLTLTIYTFGGFISKRLGISPTYGMPLAQGNLDPVPSDSGTRLGVTNGSILPEQSQITREWTVTYCRDWDLGQLKVLCVAREQNVLSVTGIAPAVRAIPLYIQHVIRCRPCRSLG